MMSEGNEEKMTVHEQAHNFKSRFPFTIAWRIKHNASIIEKHLSATEQVKYVFVGQKNNNSFDWITTCVVALTNERILIGRKRLLIGYFFYSITPEMFNDLKVTAGVLWGRVHIDTVNELITVSNMSKKALPEIETAISSYMLEQKSKYRLQARRIGVSFD